MSHLESANKCNVDRYYARGHQAKNPSSWKRENSRTAFILDQCKNMRMQRIEESDLGMGPGPRGPPKIAALAITSVRTTLNRESLRGACACRENRPQDGRRAVYC